ncbi:lantibiotic dehydratase [Streptomyces sp. ET3-23]|uniref:lantibiotic dehydratase n=1 Tax=Streptomyces sp. ET3-23 TaxID=2885643 RepID=UPI001D12D94B|nr:lantibiotic dehydratase [Streptomyces sp. ET3-23]MCC2276169.1 lantibiotic dehydratase [Streptomyces sp. ET3-23]
MKAPVNYRWRAGALLRATTDPGTLDLPRDLDMSANAAVEQGLAWLAAMWQREEVRDALSTATPDLCQQIADVVAGEHAGPRQIRRTATSLASYLLRWQGRPTPFGLFAGIAPARIADVPLVEWGHKDRTVMRADARWLAGITVRLHQCPQLLERLAVVANDSGCVRGNRYVVPGSPSDEDPTSFAPVEVSVRHNRPLAAALDAAREPIPYRELRARLCDQFPAASADRIEGLLGGLVAQNILITGLQAPMTCPDSLGHVCATLDAVDAHSVPEIADLIRKLHTIRDELAEPVPADGWPSRPTLVVRMKSLNDAAPVPLVTDTVLDCEVQVPRQVVTEAQEAVGILHRLSPYPFGYPAWRDYHARFRARYGPGTAVPVLDLVADSGLGFPAGYLGSAYQAAPRQLTGRDEKLLRLVQDAVLGGRGEIVLTDQLIADLEEDEETIPVPRAEIAVEIHAASTDAMARGAFRLLVTGTPRPGSSMAGRFAHLLPPQDQAQLADTYQATALDVIAAQLSFAPRRRRSENIARTMQLLPNIVPLAEHRAPHEGLLPLADLAVTADTRRLYLVQLSTGRHIEPRVLHALEAGTHTPPLARFLAEVTTARCAVYKSFDFGAASRLTYLPRVRYRRTILAPARWLLTADDLPGRDADAGEWDAGFEDWRNRKRIPDRITLVEHDQRLRLDLTHPVHRLVLRARLNAARRLTLLEAPGDNDLAWLGRPHELLLPTAATAPTAPKARPVHTLTADTARLPGRSTILAAQIHAHPERYDEILIEHLPELTGNFEIPPPWWFSRHRTLPRPDADQYLSLCLRLPEADAYGQAAELLHDWTARLRHKHLISHLTLATYEPQSARYGNGPAVEAVYGVFAADSAAALAQIRTTALGGISPQPLTAASLVDLATRYAPSASAGLHWLIQEIPQEHGPLDRTLRDQTLDITDTSNSGAALRSLPGGSDVAAAWQARAAALSSYRECLAEQRDPITPLPSLLRLHQVRTVGLDQDHRRVTDRLARTCALRDTKRRPA